MFEDMNVMVGLDYKEPAPDTDVILQVGDDESYVKYSVIFSPQNGNVSAVVVSAIRKPNVESWEFPWHQNSQTHINKWDSEPRRPVSNELIIIIAESRK